MTPDNAALLIEQDKIRSVLIFDAKAGLPRVSSAVDGDDMFVVGWSGASPHAAIDEPLSDAGHAADHGNFIKGDVGIGAEFGTEVLCPLFDRKARLIGEADEQESHVARGIGGQGCLAAIEILAVKRGQFIADSEFRGVCVQSVHQKYDG